MDELERIIIEKFKEEHQDWVQRLKDAEEQGEGVDVNLGGNFATRVADISNAFRECRDRVNNKKRGFFR